MSRRETFTPSKKLRKSECGLSKSSTGAGEVNASENCPEDAPKAGLFHCGFGSSEILDLLGSKSMRLIDGIRCSLLTIEFSSQVANLPGMLTFHLFS